MSQEGSKDVLEDYLESLLRPQAKESDTEKHMPSSANSVSPDLAGQSSASILKPVAQYHHSFSLSSTETRVKHMQPTLSEISVKETSLHYKRKKELQALLSPQIFTNTAEVSDAKQPEVLPPTNAKVVHKSTNMDEPTLGSNKALHTKFTKQKPYQPSVESIHAPSTTTSLDPKAPLPWFENGRPAWGQEPFHALLFKVSGLTLAVPLVSLGQIHNITDKLTPLFGQADWFMGLQETSNGRIRTINTALYVMPERYDPKFVQSAKYVISIEGLRWGLAVDEVQQPKQLHPDDVTWRTKRSTRPWLAGTVKTEMCALLDIPQMGYQLEMSQVTSK